MGINLFALPVPETNMSHKKNCLIFSDQTVFIPQSYLAAIWAGGKRRSMYSGNKLTAKWYNPIIKQISTAAETGHNNSAPTVCTPIQEMATAGSTAVKTNSILSKAKIPTVFQTGIPSSRYTDSIFNYLRTSTRRNRKSIPIHSKITVTLTMVRASARIRDACTYSCIRWE